MLFYRDLVPVAEVLSMSFVWRDVLLASNA